MKTLFVILDGAADDKRSALSAAEKPNLDMLVSNSLCGMWTGPFAPKDYNAKSMSEVANLELLGYSWRDSPGRGFLEALGIGLRPRKGSVYLRANFATVDKRKNITDRRAGRDETGLDNLSKKISMKIEDVKIRFYRGAGHRGVLELAGKGLSSRISDSDIGSKKPQDFHPLDKKAMKTARILDIFLDKSHEILSRDPLNKKRKPANFILLRGAGSLKKTEAFKKRYGLNACSVSNSGIIHGISRYLGIDVIKAGGYCDIEDNLAEKTDIALNALEGHDFVLLHINGADVFSHDKDIKGKTGFLERVDREVFSRIISLRHSNIAVTCDHRTSSRTGEHIFGHVPFLFYNGDESNGIESFDEKSCEKGFIFSNPIMEIMSCI